MRVIALIVLVASSWWPRATPPLRIAPGIIVAIGDSITHGYGAPAGSDWPTDLARMLPAGYRMINMGIDGNTLVPSGAHCRRCGPPGVGRAAAALAVPGISLLIVALGVNDILQGTGDAAIEAGYRRVAAMAHARGIPVIALTVAPSRLVPGRVAALDAWLLGSNTFDMVLDDRAALGGDALAARYDSGDGLHPDAAGYRAIASTIAHGVWYAK